MAEGTGSGEKLDIWFFVGGITLLYGLVLVPLGAWEWFGNHPPANEVLLPWITPYHPTFWWGFVLLLFGAVFTLKHRPR